MKTGPFKMKGFGGFGNSPVKSNGEGVKSEKKRNDIFLTPETPGGPKVNDNMPGMGVKEFKNFVEKNKSQKKINNKFLVNPNFLDKKVVGSHNITKDIKKIK